MAARILDGRAIAAGLWTEIDSEAQALTRARGRSPRLGVLRVGEDPASVWYLRQITRTFGSHGLEVVPEVLPADSQPDQAGEVLGQLARDPGVDGLLLQLPLPAGLRAEPLIEALPPGKDVEGLHPYNAGRLALGRPRFVPSTPLAGLEILRRSGVELSGRLAVIVGRSQVIGRPLAQLLLQANCTVVICHTRTADLGALTRQADILLAAAGRPALVSGAMLKPGAVVIDFGTNEVDGKLIGDVEHESAAEVASAITPVPGGTGPVTTAILARNLLLATSGEE